MSNDYVKLEQKGFLHYIVSPGTWSCSITSPASFLTNFSLVSFWSAFDQLLDAVCCVIPNIC